jgi:hypothetical protein
MAEKAHPYKKLPGRGMRSSFGFIGVTRCSLWLGEDHLLAVDATIGSEEYRRFYFRDIEAFIIRRTAKRQIVNWVLTALALLTAGPFLLAWSSDRSAGPLVGAIGCALFWLLFILINTLRGATCQTHIRTAAQVEELPSLNRVPVARKTLARMQPQIISAQGHATPEELVAAPWIAAL